MHKSIPEDVLQLIQTSIPSVWTLELLFLMRRSAERAWTAQQLDRELRSSELVVTGALDRLIAAGLVTQESEARYRYQPARPALGALVDTLAQTYAEFPFAITQAVLAAPNRQIRTFADAFRIKKD